MLVAEIDVGHQVVEATFNPCRDDGVHADVVVFGELGQCDPLPHGSVSVSVSSYAALPMISSMCTSIVSLLMC